MKHKLKDGGTAHVFLTSIACVLMLSAFSHHNARHGSTSSRTSIIRIKDAPIQGKIDENIRQFLGIPYAAPPVGDLRWRPPQPPSHWNQTKNVVAYGGRCAQPKSGPFAAQTFNEDCLYLNVFTPPHIHKHAALPVMVWLHGGALTDGESNDYDGSKLVKQGRVVVVTLNYRLNVFGFLALPGLDKEGHKFANYGLMDQQFALKWVKNNIAKFGGNPKNVTIFGQSAGGLSVLANVISPTAKGLFEHAIEQSGSYTRLSTPRGLATEEKRGQAFVKTLGCNRNKPSQTVSCLRSLSVRKIQSMGKKFDTHVTPLTVDGTVITKTLGKALGSGDFNRVNFIIGTTKDEANIFVGSNLAKTGKSLRENKYVKISKMIMGRIRQKF